MYCQQQTICGAGAVVLFPVASVAVARNNMINRYVQGNFQIRLINEQLKSIYFGALHFKETEGGYQTKKGLVVGDVQSGKTANYLGLINMDYDYGYRIVVLLAGATNSLREQTQKRTDSGVIGAKSDTIGNSIEFVGVGLNNNEHFAVPFTNQINDFKKNMQKNLNVAIADINKPVVLVVGSACASPAGSP